MFGAVANTSKLDKICKVYIPKDVRQVLNLDYGDEVEVLVDRENEGILLKPIRR